MKATQLRFSVCALLLAGTAHAQGFVDISDSSGLAGIRATRPADWWVSGLHFVDLDADGDFDFFMSSHGSYGALAALNDGNGHFMLSNGTYPKTEIHVPYDIDEDGKVDLSMTYNDGGGRWWKNASTPGSLNLVATDQTRTLSRQQAMVDINRDGKVDWLHCSSSGVQFNFGDGHGGFANNSKTLANPGSDSIAPIPADVDDDGDIDLVVQWGRYDDENGRTRLYLNDGDMNFTNATTSAGLYEAGLAVIGVADVDQDGDADLIGLESKALPQSIFINDGRGHFAKKVGAITGVPGTRANYADWGVATSTDFDNDGTVDLVITGRNYLHVLRGTGGGNFRYMNETWGGIENIAEASVDNGYAFADIDGDGDLDLAGYREVWPNRYFSLYRNDLPAQNWLRVRPVGLAGNRGAAGAHVFIYAAGTNQLLSHEEIATFCKQAQQNYYGLAKTERHYGLGARATVDVAVQFYPSRKRVELKGVTANTTIEIGEDGNGTVVPPTEPDEPGDGSDEEPDVPGDGGQPTEQDPPAKSSDSGCSVGGLAGAPFGAALVALFAGRRRRRSR
ncbi:MAG: VCBS repeat-containing protein [Kofleriaceae bacterium]|nr:VCBS repeat-containing protein [Kofleriaceae bacterium]